MKKVGIIIFVIALLVGVIFANFFSFGRVRERFFNFSFNHSVTGSGNAVAEKRDLSDFKAVEVGGVFQVEIVAQKEFSVEIEADDNLLPLIKTEVDGGVLKIETEKRVSTKNPIRVRISAPNIENLQASGASKISLANLKNSSLTLDSSGASKISVAGETGNLTIDVSGASNIDAENLKAENANVDASGASHISLFVSNELNADLSGASKVTYSGSPKNVIKKTSGASSVSQK